MLAYLSHRLLHASLTIIGLLTVVFLFLRLTGDPAALFLSPSAATLQELERVRKDMGLDQPLVVQYIRFLRRAISGDFGESFMFRQPALGIVMRRIPASLLLAGVSLAISVALGIPAGVISAVSRGRTLDRMTLLFSTAGQAVAPFWLGMMLITLLAVQLKWFPPAGFGAPVNLVLPSLTLGLYMTAQTARLTRSAMLDVLGQEYIRTARAKGLGERRVIIIHALRNALIPVITITALTFSTLFSGVVVIEALFAWPGIGRLLVESVFARDYPVVQMCVLFVGLLVTMTNTLADIAYAVVDPRVRLR